MRGVWIATVANIDWPSRPGLSANAQRAELVSLLDRAASLGLNTVVFQVRPAADAVYASSLEPWASLLTGRQGGDPGFDPLAFAVREAHARGLQLHAWINPFRAGSSKDSTALAPTHVFNTHRGLVRVYGTQLWLDPGDPAAQDLVIRVIDDIVRRYDIDGLHADDYFYPYQQTDSSGRLIPFPDDSSFARSQSTLGRDDWRRANINGFVARMYREAHALKPALMVGISPFGIWRPGNPPGISGLDAYGTLYADARAWLADGSVDYLAPQLYWAIAPPQQSFPALLAWWDSQNAHQRNIWPGLAAYRVNDGTPAAFAAGEIPAQIAITRDRLDPAGHLLYNATSTLGKAAVAGSLAPLYATREIVPPMPWLGGSPPARPEIVVRGRTLEMNPAPGTEPRWWVIRTRGPAGWTTTVRFVDQNSMPLPQGTTRVLVNAVSMAGLMSPDAGWMR
jgi:uncharacterized lipoprotein YddW (UPF0748 family)